MPHDPHYATKVIGDIAPKLAELTDQVLFGDVWARAQLSPRERSLATVSALVALNRTAQLPFHLRRARDNGLGDGELVELITHLAFYGGWPVAFSALDVLRDTNANE
jgi:4-carboxymuconolactone decarboxylase